MSKDNKLYKGNVRKFTSLLQFTVGLVQGLSQFLPQSVAEIAIEIILHRG